MSQKVHEPVELICLSSNMCELCTVGMMEMEVAELMDWQSVKIKKTKATGDTLIEAKNINKSLHALVKDPRIPHTSCDLI